MNFRRQAESGFTLPELLIVMAVAGILAAIAVPSFQSLTQSQQVKNASFELFSSLSLARSEAIKRNANVTVTPASTTNWGQGWTIQSTTGTIETIKSQAALKGVSITAMGAPDDVTYARTGRVTSAAAARFEIDVSGTATTNIHCIRIDLSGMPRTIKGACA